jgi:hypothetical protein
MFLFFNLFFYFFILLGCLSTCSLIFVICQTGVLFSIENVGVVFYFTSLGNLTYFFPTIKSVVFLLFFILFNFIFPIIHYFFQKNYKNLYNNFNFFFFVFFFIFLFFFFIIFFDPDSLVFSLKHNVFTFDGLFGILTIFRIIFVLSFFIFILYGHCGYKKLKITICFIFLFFLLVFLFVLCFLFFWFSFESDYLFIPLFIFFSFFLFLFYYFFKTVDSFVFTFVVPFYFLSLFLYIYCFGFVFCFLFFDVSFCLDEAIIKTFRGVGFYSFPEFQVFDVGFSVFFFYPEFSLDILQVSIDDSIEFLLQNIKAPHLLHTHAVEDLKKDLFFLLSRQEVDIANQKIVEFISLIYENQSIVYK